MSLLHLPLLPLRGPDAEFFNGMSSFYTLVLMGLGYLVVKYTYRLFLSPLSQFPGPKLGAVSKLYEAYHVLYKNDWFETLARLHQEHGPIVRIGPSELHMNDHEFCLRHHKRPDLGKSPGYYGLLGTLLGGLQSPHTHAQRKSEIQPLFTGNTLSQFSSTTLNDQLRTLCDRLSQDAAANSAHINMTHYLWAFTNDVMMAYIFGEDPSFLNRPDLVEVHDYTRAFSAIDLATMLRAMPVFKMALDAVPFLRTISPLGWLDRTVAGYLTPVARFSTRGKEDTSLTNSVLENMWLNIRNEKIVTQEAAQAIFIGNESLLSNLTFLLHHMIQNPEMIKKLRRELDTLDVGTYGLRIWADPRVLHLPYLDAICRESTRLSSPGWHRQPRQINEAVEVNGAIVPPMTSMSFTLRMLEHDPVIYPEPNSFNPDRWLGPGAEIKKAKMNSATFGTGTRTCLGQHLARVVLRKTLVAILYNFNISLADEKEDRRQGFRYLDTYPKKGNEGYMLVTLRPRFSSTIE